MSGTFAVRLGDDRDHPFVVDLGRRTVLDSVAAFRNPIRGLVEVAYDRLLAFAYSQRHSLFVADEGAERLGFLLLIDGMPDEATLEPQSFVAYTAVEPRARRRGVAMALLEAAQEHARKLGLPYMALMVTEENEAALRLYERAGFFTERRLLCKRL
jgi:ribosomal protein S18 acetylase RimI-like enzyme